MLPPFTEAATVQTAHLFKGEASDFYSGGMSLNLG
jgi:hypothetical protein